jgi:hypothetical protein
MLYEKYAEAINNNDAKSEFALYHDDWQFKFHSSGKILRNGDISVEDRQKMLESMEVTEMRCLYENEDIMVIHFINKFPNGTSDAIMMVDMKKDGLIWRTETGSTPLKTD